MCNPEEPHYWAHFYLDAPSPTRFWLAYFPAFDVMTQGASLLEAYEMAQDLLRIQLEELGPGWTDPGPGYGKDLIEGEWILVDPYTEPSSDYKEQLKEKGFLHRSVKASVDRIHNQYGECFKRLAESGD